MRRGWALPDPTDNKDEDQVRLMICVPLFHTAGLQSCVLLGTVGGAHLLLLPRWDAKYAAGVIERHRVTALVGVAFMLRELALLGRTFPSLKSLGHGGASPSTSLPKDVQKAMPGSGLGQGYGASETQGTAIANSADDYHARPASCGQPLPGIEVKIVDPETCVELPKGTTGEVSMIRGELERQQAESILLTHRFGFAGRLLRQATGTDRKPRPRHSSKMAGIAPATWDASIPRTTLST